MNSYCVFILQTVGASVMSMILGFVWFSEILFGKIWWNYMFPGVAFRNNEGINRGKANRFFTVDPYLTSLLCCLCQSALLSIAINTMLSWVGSVGSDLSFPMLCSSVIAIISECATFPHYAHAKQPFMAYLICAGHSVSQIFLSVFLIYFLAVNEATP